MSAEIINCLKAILKEAKKWGDMLKITYDTNASGVVDNSEKLDGNTLAQVRDHTPKAHKLDSHTDPDGILTTKGTLLKTGTQTEGRAHAGSIAADALDPLWVTVCFREKLTNVPSSITLSDVDGTTESNLETGYPQALYITEFGFSFHVRAAASGQFGSLKKKFLTVGN